MDNVIHLPPFEIIQKPTFGSPCNGCGWCCHSEVCKLGQEAFDLKPEQTPCPAMTFIDNKIRCGLIIAEQHLEGEPILAKALGINTSCDADDFDH